MKVGTVEIDTIGRRPPLANQRERLLGRQIEDIAGGVTAHIDAIHPFRELSDKPNTHQPGK